ncbi:Uncharacterised protein [Mycobacteroides abscessus]|nr:Uncharacterised protein [Mycobacteroides abscessus]
MTAAAVTPSGACSTTVWLNSATGPSISFNHHMIGVAVTGPVPSSSGSPAVSAAPTTSANRATVCWTKMSRGRHARPTIRTAEDTCIARMLSPPSSKNESSTPTRSSPRTWA